MRETRRDYELQRRMISWEVLPKHWFPLTKDDAGCNVKSDHRLNPKCLLDISDEIHRVL
jgi:hypothetical protein